MALIDAHVAIEPAGLGSIKVILDASQSAKEHYVSITSLVNDLITALPARVKPAIYFLGNPNEYSVDHFGGLAAQWFMDNGTRASIIAPVLESIDKDSSPTLIIIGSGLIYDLEDWHGSQLLSNAILVNFGSALQSGSGLRELKDPSVEKLLNHVCDPVVAVNISGHGFMPIWWDNDNYRIEIKEGTVSLSTNVSSDNEMEFHCCMSKNSTLSALSVTSSGRKNYEQLVQLDESNQKPDDSDWLTESEIEIFDLAVRGVAFDCPWCQEMHSASSLRCQKSGGILGKWIYPSLQERKASGFVIFRKDDSQVSFKINAGSVLRIGDRKVAVKSGSRVSLYEYDGKASIWRVLDSEFRPYCRIGDEAYAVFA